MERIRKNLDTFVQSHGTVEGRSVLEARLREAQATLAGLQKPSSMFGRADAAFEMISGRQADIDATTNLINQLTVALANLNHEMDSLSTAQWRDFFKEQRDFLASLPPISMDFADLGDIRTKGLADVNRSMFEEPFRQPLEAGAAAITDWANGPAGREFESTMNDMMFQFDELNKTMFTSEKNAQRLGVALSGAIAGALLGLAHARGPAGFAGAAISGAGWG
jgi:hypothetical protein